MLVSMAEEMFEKTQMQKGSNVCIGGLLAAVSPRAGSGKGYPHCMAEHRCQMGLFPLVSALCLEWGKHSLIFVVMNK